MPDAAPELQWPRTWQEDTKGIGLEGQHFGNLDEYLAPIRKQKHGLFTLNMQEGGEDMKLPRHKAKYYVNRSVWAYEELLNGSTEIEEGRKLAFQAKVIGRAEKALAECNKFSNQGIIYQVVCKNLIQIYLYADEFEKAQKIASDLAENMTAELANCNDEKVYLEIVLAELYLHADLQVNPTQAIELAGQHCLNALALEPSNLAALQLLERTVPENHSVSDYIDFVREAERYGIIGEGGLIKKGRTDGAYLEEGAAEDLYMRVNLVLEGDLPQEFRDWVLLMQAQLIRYFGDKILQVNDPKSHAASILRVTIHENTNSSSDQPIRGAVLSAFHELATLGFEDDSELFSDLLEQDPAIGGILYAKHSYYSGASEVARDTLNNVLLEHEDLLKNPEVEALSKLINSVSATGRTVQTIDYDNAIVVIAGATGDLAKRKLLVEFYKLFVSNNLPPKFGLLCCARHDHSKQSYLDLILKYAHDEVGFQPDPELWIKFAELVNYKQIDLSSDETAMLPSVLKTLHRKYGTQDDLFYYSVPTFAYQSITEMLSKYGLIGHDDSGHRRDVIVEKPYGDSHAAALELNAMFALHLPSENIYLVDHYLGKNTLRHIAEFRVTEGLDRFMNNKYVTAIEITAAEDMGVGPRADYYDKSGAIRDMIQNHLLQVLSLVCMDIPLASGGMIDGGAVNRQKQSLLDQIDIYDQSAAARNAVIAQYISGILSKNNRLYPAYNELDGVPEGSQTPTFAALRLSISSSRWEGVPIVLRTGKLMDRKQAEVVVHFKNIGKQVLAQAEEPAPLKVIFQIHPQSVGFVVRRQPGYTSAPPPPVGQPFVDPDTASLGPYARLLRAMMARGDNRRAHFPSTDIVASSWKIVEPFLSLDPGILPLTYYRPGKHPNTSKLFHDFEKSGLKGFEYSDKFTS